MNELIENFGLSDVNQLIEAFDMGIYVPGAKGKWAWLKLLMDAQNGDQTTYGATILMPPLIDLVKSETFQTVNGTITIGGIDLRSYVYSKLDKRMNWIFPYRNGEPTHFILNGRQYIDGNRPRDLPDFRVASLDIAPALVLAVGGGPFAVCGKGLTGGLEGVIDRFGNTYAVGFLGGQLSCLGYISVGEGYVARQFSDINWNRPRPVNEAQIRETITGFCINGGIQLVAGASGSICLNGATSATWFYTPGAGGSVYGSFGVELPYKRPDLAWDYVDQTQGYTKQDVYYDLLLAYASCK